MAVTEPDVQKVFDAAGSAADPVSSRTALVKGLTPLFNQGGGGSGTPVHNNLSGLQGGAPGDYQHLTTAQVVSFASKEAGLGNPSVDGYILSSTAAGVRSWVAPYSLPAASATVLGGVKVGTGLSIASGVLSVSYGTVAGTACQGNDSRLSNSRTPTAHVLDSSSHTISGKTAGQMLLATAATAFGFVLMSGDATLSGAGVLALAASGVTAGAYGSASVVPVPTVDAKGRVTAMSTATITPAAIGAAASGHNHDSAYLGISATAAASTKLATARTLTIGGTGKTFDGSANVSWTLAEIGAQAAGSYAAASHSHAIADVTSLQTELDSKLESVTADSTSRAANTVYAAPNGAAGTAVFRSLIAADIPSLDTSKLTSGTLGYARGGTGISAPGSTAGNLRWSGSAYMIDTASYALASAVPAASSTTPAALGTAAVGTGTTWARADHVHAMPTAAQVGAAASAHTHAIAGVTGLQTALDARSLTSHNHTLDGLSNVTITSNAAGEILKWNGSSWVNNTLAEAGIQSSLGYTPVNKAGDTMTGDLSTSGFLKARTSLTCAYALGATRATAAKWTLLNNDEIYGISGWADNGNNLRIAYLMGDSTWTDRYKLGNNGDLDLLSGGLKLAGVTRISSGGDGAFTTLSTTGLATLNALKVTSQAGWSDYRSAMFATDGALVADGNSTTMRRRVGYVAVRNTARLAGEYYEFWDSGIDFAGIWCGQIRSSTQAGTGPRMVQAAADGTQSAVDAATARATIEAQSFATEYDSQTIAFTSNYNSPISPIHTFPANFFSKNKTVRIVGRVNSGDLIGKQLKFLVDGVSSFPFYTPSTGEQGFLFEIFIKCLTAPSSGNVDLLITGRITSSSTRLSESTITASYAVGSAHTIGISVDNAGASGGVGYYMWTVEQLSKGA